MTTDNEKPVFDFCAAWQRRDIDELLGYLAEDAVYHDMPLDPVQGHDDAAAVLADRDVEAVDICTPIAFHRG